MANMRISHLYELKEQGIPWAMATAYDYTTARLLTKDAGIKVLLVGDSAANTMLGYSSTNRMSMTEMTVLASAVVRGAEDALVVVDMTFGSYEASDTQAVATATQLIKDTGAHMVKIEGGQRMAPRIKALTAAGVAVCAHVGFTPQTVDQLGGYRVQGRGEAAAEQLEADVAGVEDAGASMVVLEMVPAGVAKKVTKKSTIPTIGIGAGPDTDAQVLVWHDLAGISTGQRRPRFVREFGSIGEQMVQAATDYRLAVENRKFPRAEHCF